MKLQGNIILKNKGLITDINNIDFSKSFTFADYLTWQVKERLELIKGKIFKMTPAPAMKHQKLVGNIFGAIVSHIRQQSKCEVFIAPFDVRLSKNKADNEEITTVVQPDICVVCNPKKLDEKGCLGSPDIIVEILSPSTSKKDLNIKYDLYEEHGVIEYWVVYPGEDMIDIFVLEEEKYKLQARYFKGDVIETPILPGFQLDVDEAFVMPEGF